MYAFRNAAIKMRKKTLDWEFKGKSKLVKTWTIMEIVRKRTFEKWNDYLFLQLKISAS